MANTKAALTTRHQREMMEHAIGLPEVRGKRGVQPGWRNYYATDTDDADWLALVSAGLAEQGRAVIGGGAYFHVTDAGYAELGLKPPKSKVPSFARLRRSEEPRLVAQHIDGNPGNNDPSNIRFVTASENLPRLR